MAINQKTWNNNDHISVAELQNVQDNSVNDTDDIHPQYDGITLRDFLTGSITGAESNQVKHSFDVIPIAATSNSFKRTFIDDLVGSFPRGAILQKIYFHVKNTDSIDIDFDLVTGNTTAASNSAKIQVYRHVDGGNDVLEHDGTERTSVSNSVFERSPLVNLTIASLNASSTDFLTVLVLGDIDSDSVSKFVETKGLKVVRKF